MMDDSFYEQGYPEGAMHLLVPICASLCACSGIGPSIGRWDDKATWRLGLNDGAYWTIAEREDAPEDVQAALDAMSAFDPWANGDAVYEAYLHETDDAAADPVGDDLELAPEPVQELAGDLLSDDLADGGLADPGDGDALNAELVDEPENFGGMFVHEVGDPLKAAKAEKAWLVDDKETEILGQYDVTGSLGRLEQLHQIQQAIREGVHPHFTEAENQELQSLEALDAWVSEVRSNSTRLRGHIRMADSLDAVAAISIDDGWPE